MPLDASAGAPGEPPFPADAVEVGRIVGAWGVKGWFKIQPFAAEPQALFSSKRWWLRAPDGPSAALPPALLRVTQSREHGGAVVAVAAEVPDRNAAEALKGARVFVSRASFPTAGADEFYWVDLIGCEVANRQGALLGRVGELIDTGSHSVLCVQQGESERLIPFVAAYVDAVDLAARRITVDWGDDW